MCTQEMWQRDGFSIGTMSVLRCFCWGEEKMILRNPDGGQLALSGDDWKALLGYACGSGPEAAGAPR
jgi:hypothetical protein